MMIKVLKKIRLKKRVVRTKKVVKRMHLVDGSFVTPLSYKIIELEKKRIEDGSDRRHLVL